MSQLFGRAVRVIVGPLVVEGLRVQFKVKKTVGKTPNEAELSITNLSAQSRAGLQSKGTRIIIEAGYIGTVAQLFAGDSRYISHVHEGADWVTKVQMGDGERAYRYEMVNESFKPGTTVAQVFERVALASGLDVAEAIATIRTEVQEQYTQGYVAFGKVSAQFSHLLDGRGFEWSIQDGKLQVTRIGAATKNTAVLLSASSGLIGSPAYGSPEKGEKKATSAPAKKKPQVLKAKSLLQPSIHAGGLLRLESEAVKGTFRVQEVTHTGDTHGGDWYSEVDLVPPTAAPAAPDVQEEGAEDL